MKKVMTTNWHAARILRTTMGLAALIYGILKHDNLMILAGGFLLFMGVTNTGCGASGCGIPTRQTKRSEKSIGETTFEEVKS
ncbi:MAG: hypothetical protein ACK5VH_10630 [bacterium]